jgi:quercetin dioxygenase-like cupin family protein
MRNLTRKALIFSLLAASAGLGSALLAHHARAAEPPQAIVAPLLTKQFANIPGKEGTMLLVTYPPGAVDPMHRHDAHAFLYVLEGSIVMGVKGSKEVTLNAGQTFYESPTDIHTVGRNASITKPAKFLVIFVKDQGSPILTVVK